MLTTTTLAARPDFAVTAATCQDDHSGWSSAEVHDRYLLVLVRRGRFRRLSHGVATDVDRTSGYLSGPGQEEQFAHPAGGDRCTSLDLSPTLGRSLVGEGALAVLRPVYVDGRLDLGHRRLLAAARAGDVDFALVEEVVGLFAAAAARAVPGPPRAGRHRPPGADAADAALARAARDAITAGDPAAAGLVPLAGRLGVSPYRLSRVFSREVGVSVTRFRNRVRVADALDRLEAGEPNLSRLAADLGFADQAHLGRTVRQHLGHTPTALRRLLPTGPARPIGPTAGIPGAHGHDGAVDNMWPSP